MGGVETVYYADLLRMVRRFWYFALAGLVSTAALCFVAGRVVPPDYEAQAKVLMVPAPAPTTVGGDNPLLGIGGLQPTADTLALAFADTTVQEALDKAGATGKYEVVLDPVSKSPVLSITATDSSPAAALATLKLVVAEVPKVLADLEGKIEVPQRARLSTLVIAQDQKAALVLKSRIRLLGAVGGLGLAFTFGLLVFLFNRERQRQLTAMRPPASVPDGPEAADWSERPRPDRRERRERRELPARPAEGRRTDWASRAEPAEGRRTDWASRAEPAEGRRIDWASPPEPAERLEWPERFERPDRLQRPEPIRSWARGEDGSVVTGRVERPLGRGGGTEPVDAVGAPENEDTMRLPR